METLFNKDWLDASLCVCPHREASAQVEAFGLPAALARPVEFANVRLDVREGSSVNCNVLEVCCHGNGTHTECIGHISRQRVFVTSCQVPVLMRALVVSPKVTRSQAEGLGDLYVGLGQVGDRVITKDSLKRSVDEVLRTFERGEFEALAVRALGTYGPTVHSARRYTDSNPPYFSHEAIGYVVEELGVQHLLVDLPSVDREECGPLMPNHSIFFGLEPGVRDVSTSKRCKTTVTELCNLHKGIADGEYILSLQVAPIEMDAAPSRPIFLPLNQSSIGMNLPVVVKIAGIIGVLGVLMRIGSFTLAFSLLPTFLGRIVRE